MTTQPIRDPKTDRLLTPVNAALLLIDYQPHILSAVGSSDQGLIVNNVVALAKAAKLFGLPVVLSTVGVKVTGAQDILPEIQAVFPDISPIDRTMINSWEDAGFRAAVEATGRRKLIMGGLWTEICLALPTLDALREGYQVYFVADAVGGLTPESHELALRRLIQTGAYPVTWAVVLSELQRDHARQETEPGFKRILEEHAFRRGAPTRKRAAV